MRYSIVTPVYNREDCILRCIESVAKQDDGSVQIEHIIVDDGSSDSTRTIVESAAAHHPHVRFLKNDVNRGTNHSRNVAIGAATGDFVIYLDSDDYFVDAAFQIIDDAIRRNPGYLYYMFTPDDRQAVLNTLGADIGGGKELQFSDFLLGKISGDFIHVLSSGIAKTFPFEEKYRTYEGLTFMKYYESVKKILFVNRVVTVRERGREDSVTKEYFLIRQSAFVSKFETNVKWIESFSASLLQVENGAKILRQSCNESYLLGVVAGMYNEADALKSKMIEYGIGEPAMCKLILRMMRLGFVLRLAISVRSFMKYRIFRARFN